MRILIALVLATAAQPVAATGGLAREAFALSALNWRGRCARILVDQRQRRRDLDVAVADVERKSIERLGYVPHLALESKPFFLKAIKLRVTAHGPDGTRLGEMEAFRLSPYLISIGDVNVYPAYRNKGISELMFARVLTEVPHVVRVTTTLTGLNRIKVIQAASYLSCREALFRSPAGKMRSRFGFTKLVSEPRCGGDEPIRLIVER